MKLSNKYNNTAVIDADYIIWIATHGNKVLDSKGLPKREDGKFVYTPKTLEEAIATCDSYMHDILGLTHADSHILYLTTGPTFRHKADPTYKANRTGIEKPLWFKEVKEHLKKEWGAIDCPGLEADDMVVITSNTLESSFVIAADKDILECVPGKHFDARRGRVKWIEVSKDEALFNFAVSLLTGDPIDGVPNLEKGMGPKTAETELKARMEFNNPITSALLVYIRHLGEYQGIMRFSKQYQMLKMIDRLEDVPQGISFNIPEPSCYECTETILSRKEFKLEYE